MRVATLTLAVVSSATPATAFADTAAHVEVTGYIGVDYFADEIGLGDSTAAEQRPQTAPLFGARLTYIAAESDRGVPLALGGELELSFTPSATGYSPDGPRPSSFAPVLDYRALFLVRLGTGWLQPHVDVGVGAATVLSSTQYIARDTDLVAQWGFGATLPMADQWQLRFDARQARSEARDGGMTSSFEVMLGVGARFGRSAQSPRLETQVAHTPPAPPPPADAPPPDLDADGIVGVTDHCPGRAEDFDGFQDDDGCPDEDDDGDKIADAQDVCPREAETKNGIADDDGCPDQVPASFIASLSAGAKIAFQGKATLTPASKAALDGSITAMLAEPRIKVAITAHPDAEGADASDVAARRAEAVKWYLVEQGVAQAQLVTAVGAPATSPAPFIELAVVP